MSGFEVAQPILCSPFEEPSEHWRLVEGEEPRRVPGRRPAVYFFKPPTAKHDDAPGGAVGTAIELKQVNLIRGRVKDWRASGYAGASRTTLELLKYWRRDRESNRLFFAQLEAAETIVMLVEAREDFRHGFEIPTDEPSDEQKAKGIAAFRRYACKMATGTGKTTLMAMLAAWSILNKINSRADSRFSDVVLVVCPNVTIRNRLRELDPNGGEASTYRIRDIVPPHLMAELTKGRVIVTNWHVFEPQASKLGGTSARVLKSGVALHVKQLIRIGPKTTTAHGWKYLTVDELHQQVAAGLLEILEEAKDKQGNLTKVHVKAVRHVESDASVVNRIFGREVGGKQNILVFNDEAHHAYRIRLTEPEENEEEESEEFFKEATVWIDGLDRVHKLRGINFCVDLSATPYFLGRVGRQTNRIFPWVVSEFGLTDAIESGLVKIPQLAVRDTTGAEIPGYFNIWRWILPKLTPAERGGKKGSPKPEAILKYAHTPIAMLGGLWEELGDEWAKTKDDPRRPVFIIVCKNTKIAKIVYDWIADDRGPKGIPPLRIDGFRNRDGQVNTIRVDTKVVHETDTGEAKNDEVRWMRATLDTIGKTDWPKDRMGRALHPEGFEELAQKLDRPLHPPGRDVRCIVSVGMLTEGWDCLTVTHIVGLRPFMSQLLCEQVVGRGLRRKSYDVGEDGKFTEEVAKVFGVPFEVIPFKETKGAAPPPKVTRHHVYAVPAKQQYEIRFPRVEGYQQAIRNRVTVNWEAVAPLTLDPGDIPPEVQMKATIPNNMGRPQLSGPGALESVDLNPYRKDGRLQELVFQMARDLVRDYASQPTCQVPAHVLFPQVVRIVDRYLREKVHPQAPFKLIDVFLSPYYGLVIERLVEAVTPDTAQGEAPEVPRYETSRGPGSTADVDTWTSREVREVVRSHLNYVVADTKKWEQSAAYVIDTHPMVDAFVKNAGLGFAIPYFHNGQPHDYEPDFIVLLKVEPPVHLILETKGYDPLTEVKAQAAHRWVAAVNADGTHGRWAYALARKPEDVARRIVETLASVPTGTRT